MSGQGGVIYDGMLQLVDPTDRSGFETAPLDALMADTGQMVAGVLAGSMPKYYTREAVAGMWEVIRRQQAQIEALTARLDAIEGKGQ